MDSEELRSQAKVSTWHSYINKGKAVRQEREVGARNSVRTCGAGICLEKRENPSTRTAYFDPRLSVQTGTQRQSEMFPGASAGQQSRSLSL